jgi:mannosyltransferase OCH1-like enzyme
MNEDAAIGIIATLAVLLALAIAAIVFLAVSSPEKQQPLTPSFTPPGTTVPVPAKRIRPRMEPPAAWLQRSGSSGGGIPLEIVQTHATANVPPNMARAIANIVELNPAFGYRFFTDEEARRFVAAHMPAHVYQAFAMLVPGAYRADLFRYCYLYKKGGVYLDTGFVPKRPLLEALRPTDRFVSCDDRPPSALYQAFLCAAPGHPILKRTIDIVVQRVLQKVYGECGLWITGPKAIGRAFEEVTGERVGVGAFGEDGSIRIFHHHVFSGGPYRNEVRSPDGRTLFFTKYRGYHDDQRWFPDGSPHYGDMWSQRRVFR